MSERQEREYNRGEPYDHAFVQPPSSAADASICSFCGHKQIEHTAPWRVGGSAEPVAPPNVEAFRAEFDRAHFKFHYDEPLRDLVVRLLATLEWTEGERGSWQRVANAWERRAVEAETREHAALARAPQGDPPRYTTQDEAPAPGRSEAESFARTHPALAKEVAKFLGERGPRTGRMDLHDELDRRFPVYDDFAAFVHGVPAPQGDAASPKLGSAAVRILEAVGDYYDDEPDERRVGCDQCCDTSLNVGDLRNLRAALRGGASSSGSAPPNPEAAI